jgi:leader peptidase (prepilin peptidase)/N-methyltransferase
MIRILVTAFAALSGLAFGSFLNVCLSRWPAHESIVKPRSHCRTCGHTLLWWENIPFVSWVALRGRCRTCEAAVSWRYPLVELAVAAVWAAATWQATGDSFEHLFLFGSPWTALALIVLKLGFFWLLLALALLDAEHLWLPDWLTWPGIALGLLYVVARFAALSTHHMFVTNHGLLYAMGYWLLGVITAAALILAIRWLYWLIRRREGLGIGDAKLMALLAAWLGLPGALLAFVIGVLLGAAVALIVIARTPRDSNEESVGQLKLPLGTFLCIGGIVSSLWGQQILAAYLHYAGL